MINRTIRLCLSHIILITATFLSCGHAYAQTSGRQIYVDAENGKDSYDGLSPQFPFKSIKAAANNVLPGDTVNIQPGVYQGRIRVKRSDTSSSPITFQANSIAENSVIVTNAYAPVRDKEVTWEEDNEVPGLYFIPYTGEKPSRVLYNEADLYPYASLSNLEQFMTDFAGGSPGPRHGWCMEGGKLYVRLHPDRLYGFTDPNRNTMAISPTQGFGFSISNDVGQHAYVTIKGITFETPGVYGVYTTASSVTVQDCWFFGCPYGVGGNNSKEAQLVDADPYVTASDVIIERCEFTEKSTYNDAMELLKLRQGTDDPVVWQDIWHRKATGERGMPEDVIGYETGIAHKIGRNWVIRHNYIHDIFEGLANDSMSYSVRAKICRNVFARICDNGVETENHARAAFIYQNVFLDVFEPFSCQPIDGYKTLENINWPGPVDFYENVIANTPGEKTDTWANSPSDARSAFKIGMHEINWQRPHMIDEPTAPLAFSGNGLSIYNNTVYFPKGRLINAQGDPDVPVGGVTFSNNIFYTGFLFRMDFSNDLQPGHFAFYNNLTFLENPASSNATSIAAGNGSLAVFLLSALGWMDPLNGNFELIPNSLGWNYDFGGTYENLGAIQPGSSWFPPKVGPGRLLGDFSQY